MTALREAAQQALEALLTYEQYIQPLTNVFGGPRVPEEGSASAKVDAAITALRAALAEPPPHQYPLQSDRMRIDPVTGDVSIGTPSNVKWDASAPLVVHPHPAFQITPPQRKPLSEEELSKIIDAEIGFNSCVGWEEGFARAIERAHGIGE